MMIHAYKYGRASHTGDACRGRGRERERGISSELADMTCCELHLAVVVVVVVFVVVGVVVVVVVVIVVIAVAAWSCCRCRCYLWYFLQTPQNRQIDGFCKPPKSVIGGVFAMFHVLGTKKHRKYRCFWLRVSAKPRYLRGFEPLLAKITVFTVFCGTGIYAVSSMLSQAFFGCQRHKNIDNYTIFSRGQHQKNMKNPPKSDQTTPNKDLQNASSNFRGYGSNAAGNL